MTGLIAMPDAPVQGWGDYRRVAMTRLVLASAATLVAAWGLDESSHADTYLFLLLILYTVTSAAGYFTGLRRRIIIPVAYEHWVDIGWYTLFLQHGHGTANGFFLLYFFPAMVASFRWGTRTGIGVAVVATACVSTVSLEAPQQYLLTHPQLAFFRPIGLLVLSCLIAHWGGMEVLLKQRLGLLREVSRLANPRFGADATISAVAERLRAFYGSSACLVLLPEPSDITMDATASKAIVHGITDGQVRRDSSDIRKRSTDAPSAAEAPPATAAFQWRVWQSADRAASDPLLLPSTIGSSHPLLALGARESIIYCVSMARHRTPWIHGQQNGANVEVRLYEIAPEGTWRVAPARERSATDAREIASVLQCRSYLTIPLGRRHDSGRLYLASDRCRFNVADIEFLIQVGDQVMPYLENMRLVDQLASTAAEEERRRLANDIHDSVIQPYIGIEMGLSTVRRRLAGGDTDIVQDIELLKQMLDTSIADLRQFMGQLRATRRSNGSLLPAVRRFAERFEAITEIRVELDVPDELRISDRLAAEVFQIIVEGLNNVRKHSAATNATVGIECRRRPEDVAHGSLIVWIENEGAQGESSDEARDESSRSDLESANAEAAEAGQPIAPIPAAGEETSRPGPTSPMSGETEPDSGAGLSLDAVHGGEKNEEEQESPVATWTSFLPRSIGERTRALGGTLHVERRDDGGAVVLVSIPL
jgi:signal transduction histidine kinase